ncbi:MAG: IclR family transcriptional regulator [Phycisphaerae bacterium]|nr:IclR family transcriptional regulator [Phycisphaerae bacterium]
MVDSSINKNDNNPNTEVAKDTSRYHVPNLERALKIMELLSSHAHGMGLSEIADRLKLPKNSVFRISMTLLSHGYLFRNEDNKRFALSRKLLAVGYAAVSEQNLIESSRDVMRLLRNELHETVLLGALLEDEGVVLEQIAGTHHFKFMVDPGTRFLLHCSASGKAIFAFMPEKDREKILETHVFERFNERTITDKDALRQELAKIRQRGYATDEAEEVEAAHCVGAPIMDQHGFPVAALWTTGPSYRLPVTDFDRVAQIVMSHAAIISQRMGYDLIK